MAEHFWKHDCILWIAAKYLIRPDKNIFILSNKERSKNNIVLKKCKRRTELTLILERVGLDFAWWEELKMAWRTPMIQNCRFLFIKSK